MERLRRAEETRRALRTLEEILDGPYSVIVRDATIQRFEYTFESFWKFLKDYLMEYEGIVCNSPKSCFREAQSAGLISEEQALACLEMADDRNLTSHAYIEELAEKIFRRIGEHYKLMENIFNLTGQKFKRDGKD